MFDNDNNNNNHPSMQEDQSLYKQSQSLSNPMQLLSFGNNHLSKGGRNVICNVSNIDRSYSPSNISQDSSNKPLAMAQDPYFNYHQQSSEQLYYQNSKANLIQSDYEDEECEFIEAKEMRISQLNSKVSGNSMEFYVWGQNEFGQLGILTSESLVKIPHSYRLDSIRVKQISCGINHSALLSDKGQIYTMGSNIKGQLGIGDFQIQQSAQPVIVEALQTHDSKKICCSKNSTFALMDSGELYSWGSGKHGILGIGEIYDDQCLPLKINFEEQQDVHILDLAAGQSHTAIITKKLKDDNTSTNLIFMWGSNNHGELGLWDYLSRNMPTRVDINFKPMAISCGNKFTMIQDFTNKIYASGNNSQGQLGCGQTSEKINSFQKLPQIQNIAIISKIECKDFGSLIDSNGNVYVWGPTPIGQYNTPQKFQDLLQNHIVFKDMSVGQSFQILIDQSGQAYQLGQMNHDKNNNQVFQAFENIFLKNVQCGYDFIIGESSEYIPQVSRTSTKKMTKSYTISDFVKEKEKSYKKKRTPSATDNISNISQAFVLPSFNNQQFSTIQEFTHEPTPQKFVPPNMIQNSIRTNNKESLLMRTAENRHLEGCTPVRDNTPTQLCRLDKTMNPSTPNLRLRILNNNHYSNMPLQSEEGLNRTLTTTPLQLRRTIQGNGATQHQSNNFIIQSTSPRISPNANHHHTSSNINPLNQSQTFTHSVYQSIDNTMAHNTNTNFYHQQLLPQVNMNASYQTQNYGGIPVQQQIDILIREKAETQHLMSVEIQRRLLIEKDLNEVLKQNEQLKHSQGGIFDLQKQLESQKLMNEDLMKQNYNLDFEIQKLNEQLQLTTQSALQSSRLNTQRNSKKDLSDEFLTQFLQVKNENEQLKLRIDELENQQEYKYEERVSLDMVKSNNPCIDDVIQKKMKEIYELTVQLGCLKEENFQLKKDMEDMKSDFQERLQHQQYRAEADYMTLFDENELFKKTLDQYKELSREVQQLKLKTEQKNVQLGTVTNELELRLLEIEQKDQLIEKNKKEIAILKQAQENLLKEIKTLQGIVQGVEKRNLQLLENIQPTEQKVKNKSSIGNIDDKELSLDEIKKAANELLKEEVFVVNQNKQEKQVQEQPNLNRTHRFNPIETPLDSQRTTHESEENEQIIHQQKPKSFTRKPFQQYQQHTISSKQPSSLLQQQKQKRKSIGSNSSYGMKLQKANTVQNKNKLPSPIKKQPFQQQSCNNVNEATANINKILSTIDHNEKVNQTPNTRICQQSKKLNKSVIETSNQSQKVEILKQQLEQQVEQEEVEIENEMPLCMFDNFLQTPGEKTTSSNFQTQSKKIQMAQDENNQISSFQTQQNNPNEIKSNLVDMRMKLQDIQQNKSFLEKKIYEYEKKLSELKGAKVDIHNDSMNSSKKQLVQNSKLNTFTAAQLEKALQETRL